ncbi:putative electron transport protein YccM [compost metagenome]
MALNGVPDRRVRRIGIRKSVSLASLVLLPVTLNYFSPYLIIDGLFHGVLAGAFFVWAGFFLSGLIAGRAACAYICPYGGLQTALDEWTHKPLRPITHLKPVRYVLAVIWLAFILYPLLKSAGVLQVQPLYLTEGIVSVDNWGKAVFMVVLVVLLSILPLLFGKRATCHYLCPMSILNTAGSRIGRLLRIPSLRLKSDSSKCVSCGSCSRACTMSLDVRAMVKSGRMYHSDCIMCGACTEVCRSGAVVRCFGRPGSEGRPAPNGEEPEDERKQA